MDLPPLEDLLEGETSRVEWKQSDRDANEILQAVCALANDLESSGKPGWLLLGVDNSGRPVGLGTLSPQARDEAIQKP